MEKTRRNRKVLCIDLEKYMVIIKFIILQPIIKCAAKLFFFADKLLLSTSKSLGIVNAHYLTFYIIFTLIFISQAQNSNLFFGPQSRFFSYSRAIMMLGEGAGRELPSPSCGNLPETTFSVRDIPRMQLLQAK